MRPCPGTSPSSALTRTGALALALGLTLVTPAWAADETASTVRAVIGDDGSVRSVSRVGAGAVPSKDALPVKLSIKERVADGVTTATYRVENLTAKAEQVSYAAASGRTVTEEHTIALPLVGQLRVTLPKSYTDVKAEGAQVVTFEDGSHELLWSMVLFAPIGSMVADAVFTAKGSGDAVARLDVAPVVPADTPGLSSTAQSAVATVDGNVSLSVLTLGANEGLTALSAGVAKLLDGLVQLEEGAHELSEGLGAGADGANQLAAGLRSAKDGSGKLATGLGTLSDGTGKLAAGASKAAAGSEQLVDGSQALATGAGLTADGASKLSAGLAQLSGGLEQLGGTAGLPAALDGAKKLRAGVDLLVAGLGSASDAKTVLGGLATLGAGLPQAKGGVDAVGAGLGAAAATGGDLDKLQGAALALAPHISAGVGGPCAVPLAAPPATPTTPCQLLSTVYYGIGSVKSTANTAVAGLGAISTGLSSAIAGVGALTTGVTQVKAGLKSGDATKPGIAEGLDSLVAGLTTAVGGIGQLSTGAVTAATGSAALAAGTKAVADGAGKLAEEGTLPLAAGLGELSSGAGQLAAGAKTAAAGSAALDAGIAKLSAGQDQVAAGLPKAVDGAGKIAEGLTTVVAGQQSVAAGLSDLKTKATTVIADGLAADSDSAKRQLAALDATTARIAATPGAAGTTYVFAQDGSALGITKASSESDVARNVGIGVGGVLLLLTGLAAGHLTGRRTSSRSA